jgi:hypothetical protein
MPALLAARIGDPSGDGKSTLHPVTPGINIDVVVDACHRSVVG